MNAPLTDMEEQVLNTVIIALGYSTLATVAIVAIVSLIVKNLFDRYLSQQVLTYQAEHQAELNQYKAAYKLELEQYKTKYKAELEKYEHLYQAQANQIATLQAVVQPGKALKHSKIDEDCAHAIGSFYSNLTDYLDVLMQFLAEVRHKNRKKKLEGIVEDWDKASKKLKSTVDRKKIFFSTTICSMLAQFIPTLINTETFRDEAWNRFILEDQLIPETLLETIEQLGQAIDQLKDNLEKEFREIVQ